jgi:hypothetical protein
MFLIEMYKVYVCKGKTKKIIRNRNVCTIPKHRRYIHRHTYSKMYNTGKYNNKEMEYFSILI